jgi:hypothetical protein
MKGEQGFVELYYRKEGLVKIRSWPLEKAWKGQEKLVKGERESNISAKRGKRICTRF